MLGVGMALVFLITFAVLATQLLKITGLVFAGGLLLLWVAYNMVTTNAPFALLSLSVAPVMFLATLYFSEQARKAFRVSRQEIGNVNAELQESIAAVREVQAFNRADENIEQFKEVNAANRDANVRAVAYTSALAPTLEALSYVALAIVTGVGGWYLLRGQANELDIKAQVCRPLARKFPGFSGWVQPDQALHPRGVVKWQVEAGAYAYFQYGARRLGHHFFPLLHDRRGGAGAIDQSR